MRKLITAGHKYTVIHMGLNQSFMIASENHGCNEVNIQGDHTLWVLEGDFLKLRDSVSRLFDAEDMFTVEKVKKEILSTLKEIGD